MKVSLSEMFQTGIELTIICIKLTTIPNHNCRISAFQDSTINSDFKATVSRIFYQPCYPDHSEQDALFRFSIAQLHVSSGWPISPHL